MSTPTGSTLVISSVVRFETSGSLLDSARITALKGPPAPCVPGMTTRTMMSMVAPVARGPVSTMPSAPLSTSGVMPSIWKNITDHVPGIDERASSTTLT